MHVVFAFGDDEIGPKMLARIAKRTGHLNDSTEQPHKRFGSKHVRNLEGG